MSGFVRFSLKIAYRDEVPLACSALRTGGVCAERYIDAGLLGCFLREDNQELNLALSDPLHGAGCAVTSLAVATQSP